MAELGTLAVNADVVEEAGLNANATYTAEAYTNKYIKKAEGVLCSTCNSRKQKEEFSVKKDGNYMKTCITCVNKKKKIKTPETTPESPHPTQVHDSETEHPNPQCEAKTEVSE